MDRLWTSQLPRLAAAIRLTRRPTTAAARRREPSRWSRRLSTGRASPPSGPASAPAGACAAARASCARRASSPTATSADSSSTCTASASATTPLVLAKLTHARPDRRASCARSRPRSTSTDRSRCCARPASPPARAAPRSTAARTTSAPTAGFSDPARNVDLPIGGACRCPAPGQAPAQPRHASAPAAPSAGDGASTPPQSPSPHSDGRRPGAPQPVAAGDESRPRSFARPRPGRERGCAAPPGDGRARHGR